MGKANKPRSKNNKARKSANPINGSRKDQSQPTEQDVATRQKTILPLVEKLSSAKSEDRSMAISAINALIENDNMREMLLKEKLVHTVMGQSLTDSSEEVVTEAYGLLRNLVIEEGYSIATFLHRQDILTAIDSKMTKLKEMIEQESESFQSKSTQEKSLIYSQFENIIGLISAMALTNNDIFEAIDKRLPNLAIFLIQIIPLARSSATSNVNTLLPAVCEALYLFTEDNERVVNQIADYPFQELLEESKDGQQHIPNSARVYINGVLFNIYVEQSSPNHEELKEMLQSIYSAIINVDLEKAKQNVEPKIENDTPVDIQEVNSASAEARMAMDMVEVALELFTAIAEVISVDPKSISGGEQTSEDVMEEEDDDDEIDDETQMDMSDDAFIKRSVGKGEEEIQGAEDDDIQIDEDISFGDDDEEKNTASDPAVTYLHENILPLLINFLKEPLFTSRAMVSLNNTCWTLAGNLDPAKSDSWMNNATELWSNLFEYLKQETPLEVSTGAMGSLWAVASAFKGNVEITTQQIAFISEQCSNVKQQLNDQKELATDYLVRATGLIGTVGMYQGRLEITKASSDFVLSITSNATELPIEVVVHALNILFDLFGDKDYDYDEPVFVQGNLIQTLNDALPKVRQAVKRVDKKRSPELRAQADEAAMNFGRFIDYKRKERD